MNTICKIESDMDKTYRARIDNLKNVLRNTIITDIVDVTKVEMDEFIKYWVAPNELNTDLTEIPTQIPIDIFAENTIPIPSIQIRNTQDPEIVGEHPLVSTATVVIIDRVVELVSNALNTIIYLDELRAGNSVAIIGAFEFKVRLCDRNDYLVNETIPIVMDWRDNGVTLGFPSSIPKEMKWVFDYAIIHLAAWYGIQLALLHPATVNVFSNPKKEKRSRKDQMDTFITDENRKPKRVKYVRHHIIKSGENGVYDEINKASNTQKSAGVLTEDGEEYTKKYNRKKLLWCVIGHYRTLPDGRVTWVRSHWRGILRDMPTADNLMKNDREIDIVK